jgi:hypothetical protein
MSTAAETQAPPEMSQAYVLGQGFDVYGTYNEDSLTRPLFNLNDAPRRTWTFLGKEFSLPGIVVGIEQTKSDYVGGSFTSREGFQNEIATNAKVEAQYGAFSGQMKASFSEQVSRSTEYYYSFRNFYTGLGYLTLEKDTKYLVPEFKAAVEKLPNTVTKENLPQFSQFFATYGAYYTTRVSLGASFEFYVSTSTSTSDTTTKIYAMLEAQYKGLVFSGSVSGDITKTTEWKSYMETSQISMKTTGGDPTKAGRLAGVDAKAPSPGTVDAYNGWLETIAGDPAVVQFQLSGIWELCGDKQQTVQLAWREFGQLMRPRLTMETTAPASGPPVITLGRQIKPANKPQHPFGYQVAILDRRNVLGDDGVKFNKYYAIDPTRWPLDFRVMYNQMASDIRNSGFASQDHVLILASMGLSWNTTPVGDIYGLLRSAGAGKQLQYWLNNSDPGSGYGVYANYLFVGIFNHGAGSGVELLGGSRRTSGRVASELDIFFYRVPGDPLYSLGLGGFSASDEQALTTDAALPTPTAPIDVAAMPEAAGAAMESAEGAA